MAKARLSGTLDGKRAIVQGLGNVGYHAAKFLSEEDGVKITAIIERDGALIDENGLNVEAVRQSLLQRLESAEVLTKDEFRDRSLKKWLFQTDAGIALIGGFVVYGGLKAIMGIRMSQEEEYEGADLSVHRISSTPDREPNW